MKTSLLFCFALSFSSFMFAQSNMLVTNPVADQILLGHYNAVDYAATNVLDDYEQILCQVQDEISTDSMLATLMKLESFHTRHTWSTTTSPTIGIGAARRWVHSKFQEYSFVNENRLQPTYLQFDALNQPCGDGIGLRNVLAVLPGRDTIQPRVLVIEAHMDSRCSIPCDSTCYAPGIEDNGSGTALVMELARVMSKYTFNHTIVFMLTVGEEEGLLGGEALAEYCVQNNIDVKGVQNNDIVGGIVCGNTSSPPSCPYVNHIDSLQLRLFSNSSTAVPNRNFARTIKMWYEEKMLNNVGVPMTISVMQQEDRTGRGGDHIPFGARGIRNVRFTSANEHGNANSLDTNYVDRQHTSTDILGVDTNGDLVIDSFFVDFNYLKRNAVINAMTLTMMGLSEASPSFSLSTSSSGAILDIQHNPKFIEYRIGVRKTSAANVEFSNLYSTTDTTFSVPGLISGLPFAVSVAGIDSNYLMTPFSGEVTWFNFATTPADSSIVPNYGLLCNPTGLEPLGRSKDQASMIFMPNPFSNQTELLLEVSASLLQQKANLSIIDIQGKIVDERTFHINNKVQQISYQSNLKAGLYFAVLRVNGAMIRAEKIVVLE